jgi:hypothetical protein
MTVMLVDPGAVALVFEVFSHLRSAIHGIGMLELKPN